MYVGGGRYHLYQSSADLTSWTRVTTPTVSYALTTYQSQLVLAGGEEVTDMISDTAHPLQNATDKLWTSDSDSSWNWQASLPPMLTKRSKATAINTGTPEYLVVAGGIGGIGVYELDTVEVLAERKWSTVQQLPKLCSSMKSVLCGGTLYLMGGGSQDCDVYYCKVEHLLADIPWSILTVPSKRSFPASLKQQLIAFDRNFKMLAYSSLTKSWVHFGNMPFQKLDAAPAVLPTGQLVIVGYNGRKFQVLRGMFSGKCKFDVCLE